MPPRLFIYSRWGPVALKVTGVKLKFLHINSFQHNRCLVSLSWTAFCIVRNYAQHLPAMDKINPVASKAWRKKWRPTPEFLPGWSHGQRWLAGYSPWSRTGWKDWAHTHTHTHTHTATKSELLLPFGALWPQLPAGLLQDFTETCKSPPWVSSPLGVHLPPFL